MDELHWTVDFQCDNVTCGHTYRTTLTLQPDVLPVPKAAPRETLSLFEDSPDDMADRPDGDETSPDNIKGV